MARLKRILFILSGLVPLLGLTAKPPDTAPLVYTAYVAAYLGRAKLAALAARLPGPAALQLLLCCWLAGSLTETCAWGNNYFKAAEEPALFHPQLFADLILGLGFYGGYAVAWWLTLRFFRFTVAEAFVVTGIQGIFFEQLGAVFLAMVKLFPTKPYLSLLFGVYVFAVHGSSVGLALIPVLPRFDSPERSKHPARFAVVILLMVGLAFVGTALVAETSKFLGILPPRRSIVEHPLW